MTEKHYKVYVIQGRHERDYADCQNALAKVPADLETLSFMPLLQTDSNGGVIVTDWYANPNNPSERVKVTVSILDQIGYTAR